jgi:hypothetical protein
MFGNAPITGLVKKVKKVRKKTTIKKQHQSPKLLMTMAQQQVGSKKMEFYEIMTPTQAQYDLKMLISRKFSFEQRNIGIYPINLKPK